MLGTGADSSLVAKEVHIAFGNEGRKIEVQTVDKLQLTGIVVNRLACNTAMDLMLEARSCQFSGIHPTSHCVCRSCK
ncbi:unnamed protein product [Peronospora belbahrii]|uniref:Uncharacterized protein n=1 Tax=Peronospora belbahrii TaxID=622444 RepID=A0AAU9LFG0_9STRA|nr:unnamed protein product [Peronospora belbahrii]